jgi:WD40 repeat protein
VVTGSDDKSARIWETSSGKELAHLRHDGGVNAVAFSPDGRSVVTGSDDRSARIWETSSGKELARFSHEETVKAVAFSPEGQRVAVASGSDLLINPWLPKDLIRCACDLLPRNLTEEEWKLYIPEEPYRKTCPNLP